MQIDYECEQKHHRSVIPERVLCLSAFRGRVLEDVRYKFLNVVVVVQIDERIVAVALFHIYKVKYLYLVSFVDQQISCITQDLALRVEDYVRGVRLHDVRLCVKACFACARTAADENVQIPSVFSSVKTYRRVLRQDLVPGRVFAAVLFVYGSCAAPTRRAVFFPASVVPCGGKIDPDPHRIGENKNEDGF